MTFIRRRLSKSNLYGKYKPDRNGLASNGKGEERVYYLSDVPVYELIPNDIVYRMHINQYHLQKQLTLETYRIVWFDV